MSDFGMYSGPEQATANTWSLPLMTPSQIRSAVDFAQWSRQYFFNRFQVRPSKGGSMHVISDVHAGISTVLATVGPDCGYPTLAAAAEAITAGKLHV